MKLILHIGTEKTGTTSIQEFLRINCELLHKEGFYIPKSFKFSGHIEAPLYCKRSERYDITFEFNATHTIEAKNMIKRSFKEEISNELSNLPAHIHTVLISSELFHSRLMFQDEVDTVKELFSTFFDEFKIVVYLRSQIDLAVSYYSTFLQDGLYTQFKNNNEIFEHICRPEEHYYNYKKMLSLWENTFGDETLSVRLFDNNEFYKNDLILDFIYTISPILMRNIQDLFKYPNIHNESLNVYGQELFNILNQHIPMHTNGNFSIIHNRLSKMIINNCRGQGKSKQPDYNTAIEIMDKFYEINESIRKKYFQNHQVLFDNSLQKFNEKTPSTPEYELALFEDMIKLYKS